MNSPFQKPIFEGYVVIGADGEALTISEKLTVCRRIRDARSGHSRPGLAVVPVVVWREMAPELAEHQEQQLCRLDAEEALDKLTTTAMNALYNALDLFGRGSSKDDAYVFAMKRLQKCLSLIREGFNDTAVEVAQLADDTSKEESPAGEFVPQKVSPRTMVNLFNTGVPAGSWVVVHHNSDSSFETKTTGPAFVTDDGRPVVPVSGRDMPIHLDAVRPVVSQTVGAMMGAG